MLQSLLIQKNDATLDELCAEFFQRTGTHVSVTTMHRAVERLKISRKKQKNASEQDTPRVNQMRFEFRDWILKIDPHNLVFVDESGVNLGMARLFARSKRGERAVGCTPRSCRAECINNWWFKFRWFDSKHEY